jgi:hypothetical protein
VHANALKELPMLGFAMPHRPAESPREAAEPSPLSGAQVLDGPNLRRHGAQMRRMSQKCGRVSHDGAEIGRECRMRKKG